MVWVWVLAGCAGTKTHVGLDNGFHKFWHGEGTTLSITSVWKSGPGTGKRLGLDWTRTSQDRKSQDRIGPQPQSGPRSFAILKIPGPHKDRSGPVRTGLLIGEFINILSITSHSNHLSTPRPPLPRSKRETEGLASFMTPHWGGQERERAKVCL